jgi:hypothetical protein
MNLPFEVTVVYAGTPIIKKLLDTTDNAILAAVIANWAGADNTTKLANLGFFIPTGNFWCTGFRLTSDKACKVELGLVNLAGTTFVPLYSDQGTQAVGGGVVRMLTEGSPLFAHDGTAWFAAIRVTGATNSTITVAGDIGVRPR